MGGIGGRWHALGRWLWGLMGTALLAQTHAVGDRYFVRGDTENPPQGHTGGSAPLPLLWVLGKGVPGGVPASVPATPSE